MSTITKEEKKNSLHTSTKKKPLTVYIWNMSEDVWPFIQSISDEKARKFEINENAYLGERELFSFTDERELLFVNACPISSEFIEYFHRYFKTKVTVLVPNNHSGSTCDDIVSDKNLFQELVAIGKKHSKLLLKSYTSSSQFFHLVSLLRDAGVFVETPEAPEEDAFWTVNYFGTKSGIRQLSQTSEKDEPTIRMSKGLICHSVRHASEIAASFYLRHKAVVIKTNKGHSGAGVLLIRPGELPSSYRECRERIETMLKKDEYWERFPIVVEEFLFDNKKIGGGNPNVEFRIRKSGKIEFLFPCGMRVDSQGVFKGQEIALSVLPTDVQARLTHMGYAIAKHYKDMGYRGYFDVDCIAGRDGTIYLAESNVRRTGGTYVYELGKAVGGKNFLHTSYVLSNTGAKFIAKEPSTFTEVLHKLQPILYSKAKKEGVFVISANLLKQGNLGYVCIGKTKKRALTIEKEMASLASVRI